MKPATFDYERVFAVGEAIALLASREESKILAGGQSLVPMLNLRLARPTCLIDVAQLPLDHIDRQSGMLRIGALVTHRQLEKDPVVARWVPLLSRSAAHIGHPAIRERGTIGGSIAHADPTAELPLALVALDATVAVQGQGGPRSIRARDFFIGAFTTTLEPDEVVLGVDVPEMADNAAHGFSEFARRPGDFAIAAAACVMPRTNAGAGTPSLAIVGASSTPRVLEAADGQLSDRSRPAVQVARELVADIEVEGLAEELNYRRRLLVAVIADALVDAGWDDERDVG